MTATVPWVTWEAVTGEEGIHLEGYCVTCWLRGLGSTLAKVESIMLKDAWHWGSNNSVVNGPLGEPSRTAFFAGLPSTLGSVDGDYFPCRDSCLTGD
jgi:hypothetical protein